VAAHYGSSALPPPPPPERAPGSFPMRNSADSTVILDDGVKAVTLLGIDPCLSVFQVCSHFLWGARGSVAVKALCYKSEGRGFETR
jgi:hypothetical protein